MCHQIFASFLKVDSHFIVDSHFTVSACSIRNHLDSDVFKWHLVLTRRPENQAD